MFLSTMLFATALLGSTHDSAGAREAAQPRAPALIEKLNDRSARPPVMVIAHRTCWWDGAPENSLAGIRNCIAIDADGIEIDTVRTGDGQLVVMHDTTLDRTTNGSGKVSDFNLDDIRKLRLQPLTGGNFAGLTEEHVPSLEEALRLAKPHLIVHIHLKEPGLEADVAQLVERLGMQKQVTVWYHGMPGNPALATSPFNGRARAINSVNECKGDRVKGCWPATVTDLTGYAPYNPVAFNIDAQSRPFLHAVVSAKRPSGVRIAGGTLYGFDYGPLDKLQTEWTEMMEGGVSLILTNRPKELLELIRQREGAR